MASDETKAECVCEQENVKTDVASSGGLSGLSKRKAKKLAKIERKNQFKQERRLKERERKKERQRQLRESGGPEAVLNRKRLKSNTMANSSCRQRIAVDCSFDNLMAEKDVKDLSGQLARCYSINRRIDNPAQYYIVAANGKHSIATKSRLDILNCSGHWDVHLITDGVELDSENPSSAITAAFPKGEIVYLTSDSPNILETLDESKVYIIGGLVDHNAHKGLTFKLANEMGLAHAQLPIGQYVKMLYRKVLTVCHVFEILIRYIECKDWQKAFMDTIPKRHSVQPLEPANESALSSGAESSEKKAKPSST